MRMNSALLQPNISLRARYKKRPLVLFSRICRTPSNKDYGKQILPHSPECFSTKRRHVRQWRLGKIRQRREQTETRNSEADFRSFR